MDKRKDGGPAFPASSAAVQASMDIINMLPKGPKQTEIAQALAENIGGMSLRDYFAAHFMQRAQSLSEDRDGGWDFVNAAQCCYAMADAMLEARDA